MVWLQEVAARPDRTALGAGATPGLLLPEWGVWLRIPLLPVDVALDSVGHEG